jgi:hypothetical protein
LRRGVLIYQHFVVFDLAPMQSSGAGSFDGGIGNQSVFERKPAPDLIRGGYPVRAKKTRPNKRPEPGSDSIRTDKALAMKKAATSILLMTAWEFHSPVEPSGT